MDRFGEVVANFRRITAINRNVGFFTTGYNWLIQIIPALVVAPAFIRGEIDFGAITQSAMAFSSLVAAFSLIVTQYQSLSTFAAVVARLSSLTDAIEQSQAPRQSTIEIVEAEGLVAYEGLTLFPPAKAEPASEGFVDIDSGWDPRSHNRIRSRRRSGVVQGDCRSLHRRLGTHHPPRAGKIGYLDAAAIFAPRHIAGDLGNGAPPDNRSDEPIFALLRELNLERVVTQAGGLDSERDWLTLLSLREQQLVAFIQVLLSAPQFVFLDRIGGTLEPGELDKILQRLAERSIAYVNNETADESRHLYDAVLECGTDGRWKWTTLS